jgi:hypothetical protein
MLLIRVCSTFKSSRNQSQIIQNKRWCFAIEYCIIVKRELAEWFIAISLKLILVKSTNIRSNRIFSDKNTILLQQPCRAEENHL